MASNLTATLLASLTSTYTNSNALSTPSDSPALSKNIVYSNGSGANKAAKISYGQLSFTAAQTQTLNLNALTDPFGISFSLIGIGVKGLFFYNATATAGAWITIGPGASNSWTVTQTGTTYALWTSGAQKITLGSNGMLLIQAPQDSFAVPDTSHCQIDIYSQLAAVVNYALWG